MTRSFAVSAWIASVGTAASALLPRVALAQPSPPPDSLPEPAAVDVSLHDAKPPARRISIEWNPLPLLLGRISANLVVAPVDHHALTLSPFYVSETTANVYVFDDQGNSMQLPQQRFYGLGGEIGYRYYTGLAGPRGFFAGPSLILAAMTARAQDGTRTPYLDYGVAVDVGYEMLVVDAVAVSLGAGLQVATPDKSIPRQQFPEDVIANTRLAPRALASIGWAF